MLGAMVGCGFLSMWLSNTSATAMVMPIIEAVIKQMISAEGEASDQRRRALTGTSNLALQLDGQFLMATWSSIITNNTATTNLCGHILIRL